MFPVAFRVGELTITWYGILAATGFFLTVRLAIGRARRDGLSVAHIEWLAFLIIVSGVVGSRALFVLTQLPHYLTHPLEVFQPRQGGLVFLGGLFAAFVASALYIRLRRLPFWSYADAALPGVALGHAVGRLGCLAVGCCYGSPAPDVPWAVRFPESSWQQIAPVGEPLHPVQLYAVAANVAIFAALVVLDRHRRFPGQVGLAYLGLYGAARILLEMFRGDPERGFLFEGVLGPVISTGQFSAALLLSGSAVGYALLWRRARSATRSSP